MLLQRGVLSTGRTGKHWLLSGIFDTIGKYPENYLETLKDITFAQGECTNCFLLYYKNFKFTASHWRIEPWLDTDKFVFLDRKDHKQQAISMIHALATGIHTVFSPQGLDKVKKLIKCTRRVDKSSIEETMKFFESERKKITKQLENTEYLPLYYEDMLEDYESCVKSVFRFLFDEDIDTVITKYPTFKIHADYKY